MGKSTTASSERPIWTTTIRPTAVSTYIFESERWKMASKKSFRLSKLKPQKSKF